MSGSVAAQGPPPQLAIVSAAGDSTTETLVIEGVHFKWGRDGDPTVTFGGFPLTVEHASATMIVAHLPAGVAPGSYLLRVSRGAGAIRTADFHMTIGAAGPPGPQGPQGVPGEAGPQGPPGPAVASLLGVLCPVGSFLAGVSPAGEAICRTLSGEIVPLPPLAPPAPVLTGISGPFFNAPALAAASLSTLVDAYCDADDDPEEQALLCDATRFFESLGFHLLEGFQVTGTTQGTGIHIYPSAGCTGARAGGSLRAHVDGFLADHGIPDELQDLADLLGADVATLLGLVEGVGALNAPSSFTLQPDGAFTKTVYFPPGVEGAVSATAFTRIEDPAAVSAESLCSNALHRP